MTLAGRLGLPGLGESVGAELAQCLQQPVSAGLGLVGHQRPVDEAQHALDDVDPALARDGLGRAEVEGGREHGQPPERELLVVGEQVVGPGHGRQERAVAFLGAARATGQQAEPLVEALGDLLRRHRPDPRRGELDGEGDAVEVAADLDDGLDVVGVDHEPVGDRAARSVNSRTAAADRAASDRGSRREGRATAPGGPAPRRGPSGSRLVTTTWTSGADSSRASTRSAAASSTCSQLSRTISTRRSARYDANASRSVVGECIAAAATLTTSSPSATGASSTSQQPSAKPAANVAATPRARRVLPTPPTPVRVTSRSRATSAARASMSS